MYTFRCLDPLYIVHLNNLQEETPISQAQSTRYSKGQEFHNRQKEWERIKREEAYVDGSWDDWDKMEKENDKERVTEQAKNDHKRKQEVEARAAKRRTGMGSMSRSSAAPLPSHDCACQAFDVRHELLGELLEASESRTVPGTGEW